MERAPYVEFNEKAFINCLAPGLAHGRSSTNRNFALPPPSQAGLGTRNQVTLGVVREVRTLSGGGVLPHWASCAQVFGVHAGPILC